MGLKGGNPRWAIFYKGRGAYEKIAYHQNRYDV